MLKNKKKKEEPKPLYLSYTIEDANNEEWLTVQAFVRDYNVSESTLKRWRIKKIVPCYNVGGTYLYPKKLINRIFIKSALQNYLKAKNENLD